MFNKIRKPDLRMVSLINNVRGFTLVEMVMALAISSIVLAAVYSVFTIANKNFTTQNVAANVQQNLRSAIRLMARDIRHAGLDPSGSDNFGIAAASQTTIQFTMDSIDSGSGVFNGIVDETNFEDVTYNIQNGQILQTLYKGKASENTAVLISNIEELKFAYFDADGNDLGNPVADLDSIRTVVISMTVKEPAGRDEMVARTLTRRVQCRNLAFN